MSACDVYATGMEVRVISERNYNRAVELLKRIDVAYDKEAWQEGETIEAVLKEARSFLADIRTDAELEKLLNGFRE
jgi:hypothetical protein